MLISFNWLSEFIELDESPKEIAAILTFLGLETKVLEKSLFDSPKIITAKVLNVQKHPNADKLSVCQVTDGLKDYSIVCGAPNVANNQIVALALEGAVLPGGLEIKKVVLRGIPSEGMICSEKELGLAKSSSGIMVLAQDTPLGKPLKDIFRSKDAMLEIEINSNRPDCLSHWGVARELSAKLNKKIRFPQIVKKAIKDKVKISVEDYDLCPRYIGCKISGVEVKSSPKWLAEKLEKCGLRPINNIVDITNYVLLELGHPLHAFDYDLLSGNELIVRKARKDEKILALDGKQYKLSNSMLVIADNKNPQAIAGVMGGEDSGVTEKTKTIILESAVFFPSSIRRTSKNLNLSTDSSYRFERGTGWTVAEIASWRAIDLILQIAGGRIDGRIDIKEKELKPVIIKLLHSRVEDTLCYKINEKEIKKIFANMGMKVLKNSNKTYTVEIPSWRLDLNQDVDLIEEIARVKGYEHIPTNIIPLMPDVSAEKDRKSKEEDISNKLFGLGFSEALNYSFCEQKELSRFGLISLYRIANPLSKENEVLRPSLLPLLWRNLILNINQGFDRIKLFETGTVFKENGERKSLGIILCGKLLPEWRSSETGKKEQEYNFYHISGIIRNILSGFSLDLKFAVNNNISSYFHPGKCAKIYANNEVIGEFGIIKPEIQGDLESETCYAEIDLTSLDKIVKWKKLYYKPIIKHPAVK
ncbi:MAG: phenylalanine--tRNA ligase subunit beta, partial [Elusimicrobia bacterium]|nr:phenylalanine--tRNA ligase subunit beta [Elusimicrobiota bacterium]